MSARIYDEGGRIQSARAEAYHAVRLRKLGDRADEERSGARINAAWNALRVAMLERGYTLTDVANAFEAERGRANREREAGAS